jgi:hypothetical protein
MQSYDITQGLSPSRAYNLTRFSDFSILSLCGHQIVFNTSIFSASSFHFRFKKKPRIFHFNIGTSIAYERYDWTVRDGTTPRTGELRLSVLP